MKTRIRAATNSHLLRSAQGHTGGDIKRFCRQFKRRERLEIAAIESANASVIQKISNLTSPLASISQCSLTSSCRLLQAIPETDDTIYFEYEVNAVHIQRVARGSRGRTIAKERRVQGERALLQKV